MFTGTLIDDLTKLVEASEKQAQEAALMPFHDMNDPNHRAKCWGCLWDWWQMK